ncbi:MAG TPA: protein-disulfide reductase DsbD N-terminal domain-containing protein [Bryobacteraceae bacterium]|jgi:thiol:disulfide interchange protein DsbD|nr:protein-disulfide reductase DsbD N-terminal domain-containing protein [Bryobacteraceae bacterium]
MRRLALAVLAACCLLAAPPNPVVWKLSDAPAKALKPGARFTVKLTANIQPGWHIYSMKPLDDGPLPTRIWLAQGQPFQLAGPVKADEPQTMQDPTLHMEVELYEGAASFLLPVKVAAGAAAGAQTLAVNVQAQSCNNSICLPPATLKVEIPIAVAH